MINKQISVVSSAAFAMALFAGSAACAVSLPSVTAPVGVTAQSVAGAVSAASAVHHSVAEPIVTSAVPATSPFAAGVTRGAADIGSGISGTGRSIASNGVTVSPSGARNGLAAAAGNGVASARVGNTQLGGGSRPPVAVNIASSSPRAGTLATVGAVNSNSLLSATVAPQ